MHRLLALSVTLSAVTLASCSNGSPVHVKDCSLSLFDAQRIGLTAGLLYPSGKAIQSVVVIIDISNTTNAYQFDGPLPSNRWVTRKSAALIAQNSYDLHEHLGPVSCYVDGVTYDDGKVWFGGTPDM